MSTSSHNKPSKISKSWQGKTVWITGASSGIGHSLALKLAEMGATVIASARSKDKLDALAKLSPQYILALPMDVTNASEISDVQMQLSNRVESIDVAIFAAGIVEYENNLAFDAEVYKKVFDVHFFGLVNSVAIALPLLKKSTFKPYIVGHHT
mgnify:FL=1